NRLAVMVAEALGARLSYTWWAQRRGFVRNALKAGRCDVVMGVPAQLDMVETTRPYYRSRYVFVTRADRHLDIRFLNDPRLRTLRIGVHLIGDDGFNTPPAHALGEEGIVGNVVGFPIYGDYREADPPARIVDAVIRGDIDVAAVWGPLGGYFARHSPVPLRVDAIDGTEAFAPLLFAYDIAMGVRKGDDALRDRLDGFIAAQGPRIRALLESYGVPIAGSDSAAGPPPAPVTEGSHGDTAR
ncbi:MAG: quinoprotein dehydrogenase-associated putative ABC transporter substrate-binding protein, partial [Rhodospirillaceae bacterium]|nr:quinoprotein dehydrogenase-associated putative ABC transporter substrate-binding protein [Rhodospirillaceae bacterium]